MLQSTRYGQQMQIMNIQLIVTHYNEKIYSSAAAYSDVYVGTCTDR